MEYLSLDDLYNVRDDQLPMLVISDNLQGAFGLLIKLVTHSFYSHFMFMHKPGMMATQSWWFHEREAKLFKKNSLKVFWCPSWTPDQRKALIQLIEKCMSQGWWATRYDVLGVVGQFLGWDWLQNPNTNFCSEHFSKLALVDADALEYLKGNKHPTPEEINVWLKEHEDRYPVYCRVVPG